MGITFILVGGMPIRGTIAGVVSEDQFTGRTSCMESFWYVDPNERGSLGLRLWNAWETEAKRRGAMKLLMAHLCNGKDDKFEALYGRRGYVIAEKLFSKELA